LLLGQFDEITVRQATFGEFRSALGVPKAEMTTENPSLLQRQDAFTTTAILPEEQKKQNKKQSQFQITYFSLWLPSGRFT
jgi:hypothetical protein